MVLLDRSLKILAYDRGAAAILRDANQPAVQSLALPKEILDNIRQCKLTALSALRLYLRIGKNEYMCRAYLLEWLNWLASQPIVAVHLMRILTSNDAVHDASAKYQLTAREQEALRGISLGLANKTIADRMAISPNTVKAFLRLIMIKMGVTSRAGIVATMLQNRATVDKRSGLPGFLPGSEVKVNAGGQIRSRQIEPIWRIAMPRTRQKQTRLRAHRKTESQIETVANWHTSQG